MDQNDIVELWAGREIVSTTLSADHTGELQHIVTDTDPQVKKSKCEEIEEEHPLFMIGLPSSFLSNRGLAAIASLMEEKVKTSDDKDGSLNKNKKLLVESPMEQEASGKEGGGKLLRTRASGRVVGCPYKLPKKSREVGKETVSVSEAQVYLNLWKL